MPHSHHIEQHYTHRTGWLRASVMGANDGIISVSSLVLGMAASGASANTLLISCVAGLISGAVSMAAGEYISVKTQADIEAVDLSAEAHELKHNPEIELKELTQIYIHRGLSPELASQVAIQLSKHNALEAHARDEIGMNPSTAAQPIQAAFSSALSFSIGAVLPLIAIWFSTDQTIEIVICLVCIISLMLLGAIASYFAGTALLKGSLRVTLWGIVAMLCSTVIGSFFSVSPI